MLKRAFIVLTLLSACGVQPCPPAQPCPAAQPCQAASTGSAPACQPGQMLDNGVCVDVAVSLAGLRWEMPCASEPKQVCSAKVSKPTFTTTIGGVTGRLYAVTLWFRGVVEQQSYRDGVADGMWYVGGASANGAYNIYKLEVSDPPQTFFLNAGRAGVHQVWALDYQKTIKVRANATLTLSADAQDGSLIGNFDANGKPIVVTGVPPAPQPFNGQFIQMDVVSVTPAD